MKNPVIIRNYDIIKNLVEETEVLTNFYKLSQREINIIHTLCLRHNSFNAYIELSTKDFTESRRVVYRGLDKLENECIICIVNRPKNQYDTLQVYFTVEFIKRICGKEYSKIYRKWLDWQKSFKN